MSINSVKLIAEIERLRALNAELSEKVRQLTKLLEKAERSLELAHATIVKAKDELTGFVNPRRGGAPMLRG